MRLALLATALLLGCGNAAEEESPGSAGAGSSGGGSGGGGGAGSGKGAEGGSGGGTSGGSSGAAGSGGIAASVERCAHLDELAFEPYFLQNNMWGMDGSTGFEQCIWQARATALPFGWRWNWPDDGTEQVRAYPFVGFGQDPWRPTSTSPVLPRRAAELDALTIAYDARITASGRYNLAFDVWITSAPGVTSPPESNITRELMVWLDYTDNPLPLAWLVGEVTIAGVAYEFYRGEDERTGSYVRDYLAFLRKSKTTSGTTPLHEFVGYLLDQGHILPDEFVRNVFLGNEIWSGTGEASFAAYSVSAE